MVLQGDRITPEWIRESIMLLDGSLKVLVETDSIPDLKWICNYSAVACQPRKVSFGGKVVLIVVVVVVVVVNIC